MLRVAPQIRVRAAQRRRPAASSAPGATTTCRPGSTPCQTGRRAQSRGLHWRHTVAISTRPTLAKPQRSTTASPPDRYPLRRARGSHSSAPLVPRTVRCRRRRASMRELHLLQPSDARRRKRGPHERAHARGWSHGDDSDRLALLARRDRACVRAGAPQARQAARDRRGRAPAWRPADDRPPNRASYSAFSATTDATASRRRRSFCGPHPRPRAGRNLAITPAPPAAGDNHCRRGAATSARAAVRITTATAVASDASVRRASSRLIAC